MILRRLTPVAVGHALPHSLSPRDARHERDNNKADHQNDPEPSHH
jgi:hypothetical protein